MENDPLEWGIQTLPRRKPDLEPFVLKRYQKLREQYLEEKNKTKVILPAQEDPAPSIPDTMNISSINDSNSSISISDLCANTISSILGEGTSTSLVVTTTTTSTPSTTTTTSTPTSSSIPITCINTPCTSSTPTLSSTLSITSILPPSPQHPPPPLSSLSSPLNDIPTLQKLVTSSNETPSNASVTSSPAKTKTSQQENKNIPKEEEEIPFNESLLMMEKMIPIKQDNDKMIEIIIKLNETLLEEEEKESALLKKRLSFYHERQLNILKLYRLMNTLHIESIDEPMECLKEIFRIKIPKIRFPLATKESMVIQKQLLNLLYEIDPKSVPKSFVRKGLIDNVRERSESPSVSISVIPIKESEIKTKETSTITNDSAKISDNTSSLIITPTFTPITKTNTQSNNKSLSSIKKEDDDITVTYISNVSSNKKDEKSIPIFDLTVLSDDDETNDEENTNIMVEKLEKKFSNNDNNNEVSINVSNIVPTTSANSPSILRSNLMGIRNDTQQPDLNIEVVNPTKSSNENVIAERTKEQKYKTTKLTLKNLNSGGLTISLQPNSQSNAKTTAVTSTSSLSTITFSQIRALTAKNSFIKTTLPPSLAYLNQLKSQRTTSTITSSQISQTQTSAELSNSTTTSTATRAPIIFPKPQSEQNSAQCPPKITYTPNAPNSCKQVMVFKDQKGIPYYVPLYTNSSNNPIAKITIPGTMSSTNINTMTKNQTLLPLANTPKIVNSEKPILTNSSERLPIKIVPTNDNTIKKLTVRQLLEIQNAIANKKMPNMSPTTSTQLLTKISKAINRHCHSKLKNFVATNAVKGPPAVSGQSLMAQPQSNSTIIAPANLTPIEITSPLTTVTNTSLPTVSISSSAPVIKLKASSPLLAGKLLTLSTTALSSTSTKFLTSIPPTKLTPITTTSTADNSENKNKIPVKIITCTKQNEEKNEET